jgi:hypothetical protein
LNELLVTALPLDLVSRQSGSPPGGGKAAGLANPPPLAGWRKISYLASLFHWTTGVPKVIYYLAPPWILFSGTFPIANFDRTFVMIYLTFLGTLIATYQIVSRGKGRLLMDELFNMVSFFTLLRAIKRAVFGRGKPGRFEVTSKRGGGDRDFGPSCLTCCCWRSAYWRLRGASWAWASGLTTTCEAPPRRSSGPCTTRC